MKNENLQKYLLVIVFGVLSGYFSWYLSWKDNSLAHSLYWNRLWLPGLIFGMFFVLFLQFCFKTVSSALWLKKIIFIGISVASYFIAVKVVFGEVFGGSLVWEIFFAGLLGSFFLCLGYRVLFRALSFMSVIFLAVMGGFLGWSLYLGIYIFSDNGGYPLLTMFVVWQTGMLLFLKYLTNRNARI